MVFSSPAVAQVYYPSGTAGHRSPEAQKAAEASKSTLQYDPHDLTGIWRISNGLMGGAPAPPMTVWGLEAGHAIRRVIREAWAREGTSSSFRPRVKYCRSSSRGTASVLVFARSIRTGEHFHRIWIRGGTDGPWVIGRETTWSSNRQVTTNERRSTAMATRIPKT